MCCIGQPVLQKKVLTLQKPVYSVGVLCNVTLDSRHLCEYFTAFFPSFHVAASVIGVSNSLCTICRKQNSRCGIQETSWKLNHSRKKRVHEESTDHGNEWSVTAAVWGLRLILSFCCRQSYNSTGLDVPRAPECLDSRHTKVAKLLARPICRFYPP